MGTVTLNAKSHELARRGVLETAATDTGHVQEELRRLAEAAWPVLSGSVDNVQELIGYMQESLAAIEEIGWPDTTDPGAD